MTYEEAMKFLRYLHETGVLSIPPEAFEAAVRSYVKENHGKHASDV
jgi:hypothetical protein